MTKAELEIQMRNIAEFSNLEYDQVKNWLANNYKYFELFQEEFKQIRPEKLELAGAVITNRSLKNYKDVLLEKVEVVKNIGVVNEIGVANEI